MGPSKPSTTDPDQIGFRYCLENIFVLACQLNLLGAIRLVLEHPDFVLHERLLHHSCFSAIRNGYLALADTIFRSGVNIYGEAIMDDVKNEFFRAVKHDNFAVIRLLSDHYSLDIASTTDKLKLDFPSS
jgi:hypothetical protein